jgi:predicted RNase H-like HicB family nuclease
MGGTAMKLKAISRREESGRLSAALPALPGCISVGDSLEKVRANIREAAQGVLDANDSRSPFSDCKPGTEDI